jgi:hypothetical protein
MIPFPVPPPDSSSGLPTITEENDIDSDDFESEVEFDLLTSEAPLPVTTTSGTSYMYSDLMVPLGSVRSVSSSTMSVPGSNNSDSSKFDVIIDSGCTRHMMPFRQHFITYKPCHQSYVILADKSRVPCLGRGIIHLTLGDKQIILHDVLHFPHLRNPPLSVHCLHWLQGCSFLADNSGRYLSFPNFIIPVDDSSDCIIPGRPSNPCVNVDFDSQLFGSVAAVSDNTHFRASQ